ncbi:hypothetical protein BC937DRAFT_88052 [Endogone sp. FLAS-F59071]|nr:hypothetical protein BC937DRAFT_88052 [Endogone sp. FLAS-F59071]|eukprot:RUS19031.1 hypothetical protein BC937DRAFT_88052 [Endogone sp. FLAS-F59071]
MDWRNSAILAFTTAVLATTAVNAASICCYETSYNQFSPNNWQLNFTALHLDASKYGYDFRASIDFPSSYVIEGDPWSPYVLTCTKEAGQDNKVPSNTYDCESTYTQQFFSVFTLTLGQPGVPHANNFTLFGDSCDFSNDCAAFMSGNAYPAADTGELYLGFGTYPTWAVVVVLLAAVIVIVLIMFVILRRMVSKGDPETGGGNVVGETRRNMEMEMGSKETPHRSFVNRHRAEEDDTDDPSEAGDGKTEASKISGKSSRRSLIRSSERSSREKNARDEDRYRSYEPFPPLPKSTTDLGSGMLVTNPIAMPMSPVVMDMRTIDAENQSTEFLNRRTTASTRKSRDIGRDEEGDMGLRGSYSGRRDHDYGGGKRRGSMGRESNKSLRDEANYSSTPGEDKDLPPIPMGSSRRSKDAERERGRRDRDEVVERGRRSARQSHEIDGSNPKGAPSLSGEGRSRSLTHEDREFMLEQRTRSRSRDRMRGDQMSPVNEDVFIPRGGLPPVPSIPAEHQAQSPILAMSRGRNYLQDENDGFPSPRSSEDYRRGDSVSSPLRKSSSKPDLSYRDREAGSSYAATKSTPPSRSNYTLPRRPDDISDDNVPLAVSDDVPLGMIADPERLSLSARRSLADMRTPAQRERDEWLARSQRSPSIDALNRPTSPRDNNRPASPRPLGGSSSVPHSSDDDDNLPVGATVPLTPIDFLSNPVAKYRDRTREKQYERERDVDLPGGSTGKRSVSERSSLSAGDRSGTVFDANGFPILGPGAKKAESETKPPPSGNMIRSSMIDPWADPVPNSSVKAREDEPWVERAASPVKAREDEPRVERAASPVKTRDGPRKTKSNDAGGSEDDRPIGLRHERSTRTLGGSWELEQSEDDVPLGLRHERSMRNLSRSMEQERSVNDIPKGVRHERSARSLSGARELERMRDYDRDRDRDRPASPYSTGHHREQYTPFGSYRGSSAAISASNLSTRSGVRYGDDESGRQSPRYMAAGSKKEADDGYGEREERRDRLLSSASKRAESRGRTDSSARAESRGRSARAESRGRMDSSARAESRGRTDSNVRAESRGRTESGARSDSRARTDSRARADSKGRDGKRLWDDEIPIRRVMEGQAKGSDVEDVVVRKLG